jgi:nucleoside-diphosphate-sugar epimerase
VSFQKSFELPAVIVRPFNTYGPHQSARALVPTVLTQALTGNPVKLGALHPTRDLLFVDDTVVGLLAAAQSPEAIGRTVALGTGRETSVADVVEVVGEVLGRTLEVEVEDTRLRPPASEVDRLVCDPSLAGELFQWRATTTLEEGLATTATWFADRLDRTRVGEYMT